MKLLQVDWQGLLDAHQGFEPDDPELQPLLRLDSGLVTCPMLLGEDQIETLPVPIKGARNGWKQRADFANGLCDADLRERAVAALSGDNPFFAFQSALETVPVEAARWIEEERL